MTGLGAVTKKPNILRNLKILEVSSVDKGAGEGVRIVLMKREEQVKKAWAPEALLDGWAEAFDGDVAGYCKREFTQAQRDAAEDKGHAMPGGGFPIENESDLHNAIQAIGRAKNPAAAKAHIKRRAKAMGLESAIPDTWKRAPGPAADEIDIGAIPVEKQETEMTLDELKKLMNDQISAAIPGMVTEVNKAVSATVTEALKKMTPSSGGKQKPGDKGRMDSNPSENHDGEEERKDAEDDCDAETRKALAIATLPPEVRKIVDDAEKNSKLVAKYVQEKELEAFSKRATTIGLKKEDGVLLQKAYGGDVASQKVLEERMTSLLKASKAVEETSVIFREFGKANAEDGAEGGSSAYEQLMAKAEELRKKDGNLTQAQAYVKVSEDPANRELIVREKNERMAKIHHLPGAA